MAKVEVILADESHLPWLQDHAELIRTELNVKEVELTRDAEKYISYQVQPNFKRLGPRVGKLMPAVKKLLDTADGGELLAELRRDGQISLNVQRQQVTLDAEDIQIRLQAKKGWAAAQGTGCVVVLSTELTEELIREGLARDMVRLIQEQRKRENCDYTDRIRVQICSPAKELAQAVDENRAYIESETLATELQVCDPSSDAGEPFEIGSFQGRLQIEVERPGD